MPAEHVRLKAYRRRALTEVTAIPLRLEPVDEATGVLFRYAKWGGQQQCKPGDWLVQNGDEVYTVDAESFRRTYEPVSPGRYRKTATVWAVRAESAGAIPTKEGESRYEAGDWLVYNDEGRLDGYAVAAERFADLYVEADECAHSG